MQAKQSWFSNQAFGRDAADLVTVKYKSHKDALLFLQSALNERAGIGVLQGPEGSGKTTIARRLGELLPGGAAVAYIDGDRIKPGDMLVDMLAQYGYVTDLGSNDELENMVKVFATQQTRSYAAPVLIVDNIDRMFPSALRTLNSLAEFEEQERCALRIVVTGRDGLGALLDSEGMPAVRKRVKGKFRMQPLTPKEALIYLHARLSACGVNNADTVFPVDVCDRLTELSGGWPGRINQCAMDAISQASGFPLKVGDLREPDDTPTEVVSEAESELPVLGAEEAAGHLPPRLTVSKNGRVVQDFAFRQNKVLLGRSDFADVIIEDQFVSKMHAILLLYSDALVLLDLNSSNGTTVNSVRVTNTILKSGDVISLGDHRIKVASAPAISDEMDQLLKSPDTIKMKSLVEMRRRRAHRLQLVKPPTSSSQG